MFDGDECDWLDFVFHGSVPFFCEVGVRIVGVVHSFVLLLYRVA